MVRTEVETRALLRRTAELRKQLKGSNTSPTPEELAKLSIDLAKALAKTEKDLARAFERADSIEAERLRYHDLFEYAPDAYLITSADGKIIEANEAAATLFGAHSGELVGKHLTGYIAESDQKLFSALISRIRHIQDIELCIQPRGKPGVDCEITFSTIYDQTGQPERMRWLLRNVTERKRALAALDASERRFRTIFDEANLGIVLIDMNDCVTRANRAFQEMLGYSEQELYGRKIAEFNIDKGKPEEPEPFEEIRSGRLKVAHVERCCRTHSQAEIWTNVGLSLLRDERGKPQFVMAMVENITAEKQTKAELDEMRYRLLESGEVERLRLAEELHDGPMQDLYGAVFRISNYLDQTEDPVMKANLKEAQEILKQVAGALREINGELRPPTLANLGLERAIRSHAERIQERNPEYSIQLHLTKDGKTLPAHTRLALFRIYQQCMTNILRHAKANQIMVAFHLDEKELVLDMWDNGCGFTLPEKWVDLLRHGKYGLAGIAERVQALGGVLKIETQPGAGTLVHVSALRPTE